MSWIGDTYGLAADRIIEIYGIFDNFYPACTDRKRCKYTAEERMRSLVTDNSE